MIIQADLFRSKHIPRIVWTIVLLGLLVFVSQAAFAQSGAEQPSPRVTGITGGRARAIIGGVIAIISIIVGWRAKTNKHRSQAIIALLLAGVAITLSLLHLSTSAGAVLGSGSGKAGAIVALILALIGATVGALAFRSLKNNGQS